MVDQEQLKFVRSWGPYNAGERASFLPHKARQLCDVERVACRVMKSETVEAVKEKVLDEPKREIHRLARAFDGKKDQGELRETAVNRVSKKEYRRR